MRDAKTRPTLNAQRRDATWEAIHDAAVRLFGTRGFTGTGIRAIAHEAGVTMGTLYYYMETKEDLLVGIMQDSMETLIRDGARAMEDAAGPDAMVAGLVREHVRNHALRSLLFIVGDTELRALSAENRAAIVKYRDQYELMWRRAIEDGVRQELFQVVDVAVASTALIEMCTGVAHWYNLKGRLTIEEIATLHVGMALNLLGFDRNRETQRTTSGLGAALGACPHAGDLD